MSREGSDPLYHLYDEKGGVSVVNASTNQTVVPLAVTDEQISEVLKGLGTEN